MLKERLEKTPYFLNGEREPVYRADVVVFGSGVMGLLLAKKLGDLGQNVVVVEKTPTVAHEASIKNHGWLHRGSAHAVSIRDPDQAKSVVKKLIYGHEYIRSYSPECVEDPFEPIFVLTLDPETASRAVETWKDLEVFNREISKEHFSELDSNIRRDLDYFVFQTQDLRINNRILFQRLVTDIRERGGLVLTGSSYTRDDFDQVRVSSSRKNLTINSEVFVYCTGNNIAEDYQKLTGQELNISFWKSHLLLVPQVGPYSVVSLDRNMPIIINHGELSVVNRAYDEAEFNRLDLTLEEEQVRLAYESLCYLYPAASSLQDQLEAVACAKPTIRLEGQGRHSVSSQIFEPIQNHYFVLPGKMTEAPYVADEVIQHIYSKLDFEEITQRPVDRFDRQKARGEQPEVKTFSRL